MLGRCMACVFDSLKPLVYYTVFAEAGTNAEPVVTDVKDVQLQRETMIY